MICAAAIAVMLVYFALAIGLAVSIRGMAKASEDKQRAFEQFSERIEALGGR